MTQILPVAVFPRPEERYDSENEAQFRSSVEQEFRLRNGIFSPADYAGINVDNNTNVLTVPVIDSYVLIQDFDVNAASNISTADFANARCVVADAGDYEIFFNIAASSVGNNKTFAFRVFGTRASKVITGATQANPVVVTAVAHGLANGGFVKIASVGGMVEINDRIFTVASVAANTFELQDDLGVNIDGTGFTAYTTGGTARLAARILFGINKFGTGGDIGNLSAKNAAGLLAGDHIELHTKNTTDATDITIGSANLTIKRFG